MSRHASPRSVGRIRDLVRSWELYLKAVNRSARTIQSYQEAALQFDAWLDEQELPVDPDRIERRHVAGWLAHLLGRWSASTAAARYRSLRQFFRWLEEGEIDASPMAKMRPPKVPEEPVPVLTDNQLGALLDAHDRARDDTTPDLDQRRHDGRARRPSLDLGLYRSNAVLCPR